LTGPAITEAAAGEIGLGTIVLSAPAGFEFNTAATVTVLVTGSSPANRNINDIASGTSVAATVTANTITFTVTAVSTRVNTLTWNGIQVRPTAATPLAGGNITHTGTSTIAGVTGATNFGTLSEYTSTPECILTTPTVPSVTTHAATALTVSGATLNGTVSSNLAATTASFEYGLTTGYGSTVAATPASLPADAVNTAISAPLTGLVCGTTYHFRAKGVSSVGTSYGGDLTFTTSACPPQVTLTPASGGSAVPSNTAPSCGAAGTWTTLTGPVVAETAAAQIGAGTLVLSAPAGFEFNPAAAVTIRLTGSGNRNNNINNRPNGTAMATTVTASTITFTVNAGQLSVVANTLTWQNIQVRPTLYTPLASGNITHTGTSTIVGVTNGATNFGTLTEAASTPLCHTAPTAITGAATGITFDTATLNGTVSSNGADTTVSFQWGLTTAYGETIPAIPGLLLASAVGTPVSADLIGVNCNTLFHYRVVATNSAGTSYGADQTLTTGACTAPFPPTACAATRYGEDLGCTSADVGLTNIAIAPTILQTSCVSGAPVTLDLDLTINFSSPDRYDVGIFIANDGKLPTVLPANGGSGSCSVDVLPITPPPSGYTFPDLDGAPQGTLDTCGDGNNSIDDSLTPGGTVPLGDGVKRMTGVTLPCYASPASGGKLFVPFVVTWDSKRSPLGFLCTSNQHPVPNTKSRCSAPASSVSINVVVLPVVTKSNGGTQINPGANTTYTVTITNNSGGTLLDMVFTDPAVTDPLTPLTVSSVSCASNGGATCPAMTSAAMIAAMQGAGIPIPSASLPSTQTTTSSLTFTINATLAGTASVGSHLINTASVSVGGNIVSATDDDLIVIAPSVAKSFAPSTIAENAASLLTVTLTNPTASDVTAVSFSDIYPAGLTNAATANGTTTCGGTVTAANNGNSLALSGGSIPANGSCTVTANVTSAAAGSYTNSTGVVTHAAGSIPAASAVLTVNVAVFGAFNACDVGTPCTNTSGYISTKIAGAPFSLDIVALNTNGTRNTNYSNTVIVELLDASNNGGTLDSYNCRSTWTVIATLAPNPSFSPANNGLLSVGPFTVPEAWRDVRVRVRNAGGPARIGCSTDNFAIRPASIAISASDTDWQTAGLVRALNNADAAGAIVHKAGQPFTVTATALNAAAITTANYAGTPALTVGDCTPGGTACTASLGTFALGVPSTFASGVLASNVASYSEAGAFSLTLQDTTFASVDALDTAPSCAGYYVCSAATAVGRFVPDHFAVASLPVTEACATAAPFTYLGQDGFVTAFTLEAQNAGGSPTLNYSAATGLAKLPISTAWGANPGFIFSASAWNPAQPAGAALAASTSVPLVTSSLPWVAGSATFSARHQISRPTGLAAPTMVTVSVLPVDADGVTVAAAVPVGTSVQRFGRLRLSNAFGSSAPLLMPVEAQYWSGMSWVKNSDDSCTALAAGNLLLDPVGWPAPAPFTLAGGGGDISLAPTGPGSVSICADLGADPVGGVICLAATSAAMPWLQSRWPPGSAYDNDPSARATFGIYAPETRKTIHIREQF